MAAVVPGARNQKQMHDQLNKILDTSPDFGISHWECLKSDSVFGTRSGKRDRLDAVQAARRCS
jgi:hypothetical protein